ncbi:O-acyltransferase like protein-like isoform X2 [Cimex lectularius]|uniref:Nose resistant-to-fluoxetine protein N-terminal domain-containing protein n=1 Tax=Cimex lectularius TaxID=79782 RepID=A0A8I6TM31_CIMLE|nr:O-acyltransferase like protein-like isoform X2 [Cimex lectularius]
MSAWYGCNQRSKRRQNRNITENECISTLSLSSMIQGMLGPVDKSSRQCIHNFKLLIDKVQSLDISALQIIDSWGKPSSGILQGNMNQYGDFDECINSYIKEGERKIDFQYCLLTLDVALKKNNKLDPMIHSYYVIKNNHNDPMHRIPHFSSFHWGVCIPKSCRAETVSQKITQLAEQKLSRDFSLSVKGSDKLCYSKKKTNENKTFPALLCILFILAISLISSTDTIYIWLKNYTEFSKYLRCFSLKRNFSSLMKTEPAEKEINAINGTRVLSALALLLSHKHMALLYIPYVNRTAMAKMISHPWTVIGRTAIIYTDGFILISGFLTANTILKELKEYGRINIRKLIANRLARLTPSLLMIIMISTWILPELNDGPLWNVVITKHSDLCKKYWWRNLLYIHNYFGFENMCLTHTHQLGIDFQLFLSCIVLILLAWKNSKMGFYLMAFIGVLSTALRFVVTYSNKLSVVIYYGISVSQLFNTANLSYILPTHRATVYLMGVGISFYLNRTTDKKISQPWLFIGWCIASICGVLAMFGPYHMSYINYKYDVVEAAFYNAFSPILWGIFVSWGIITSTYNQAGYLGDFLAWRWFKVIAKTTYSVYLIQFPVFFHNIGTIRSAKQFTSLDLFNIFEYASIAILSVVMTLAIEMPISNIARLYWKSTPKTLKTQSCVQSDLGDSQVRSNPRRRMVNIGK